MSLLSLRGPVEVAPGVHQLPAIGARVTAVAGSDGVLLIDSGTRGSLSMMDAGLKKIGYSLADVRLIVLTHVHPDHAGGLAALVQATSAPVAVHEAEAGFVSGAEPIPSPYRLGLVARATRPVMSRLYGPPVRVEHSLADGATLDWSEEIRVVHTPGHTAGSISLYLASQRLVIVGDALQYRFRRLSGPAWAVTKDPAQANGSLARLVPLDFNTIAFSHFAPLEHDAKGALERLIGQREDRTAAEGR